MDDIYSRIRIVPTADCVIHEGIVQKWVDQIAQSIRTDGFQKNPIIVTRHKGHFVVLDGMHRFAAIRQLEIPDILVCEVDYFDASVILEGWDLFTFTSLGANTFLRELFPRNEGFEFSAPANLQEAREKVLKHELLLAAGDRGGEIVGLKKRMGGKESLMETLCEVVDKADRVISERFARAIYVDNSLTMDKFENSTARSVVLRPQFTKQEVLERTLCKKVFPPKSTRHLIPERPLRVDVDLSLLRAAIDLKTKNQLLQDHLEWCYENNRVRFYPESVFIFSD